MRSHEPFNVNFAPTIPSIPHNNSSLHVENEAPHVLPAISGSRALSNHILWRSAYRRGNFVNPGTLMGPNHLQKKETVIDVEVPHSDLILTGQSESANAASTTAACDMKHRRRHHRTHRSGVLSPGGAMALSATNIIGAVSTPTATLPTTPIGRSAAKQNVKSTPSVGVGRMDAGGGEPPAGTIERPSSSGADGSAAKERRMEQQRRQQEFGAEKAFSTPIPLRHVPSFFVGADEEEDDKSNKAQSSIHGKTTPSPSSINRPYIKATATTVNGGMTPGDKDGGLGGHFGKKPSISLPKGIPLPTSLAFTRKRQIKFRRKVYEFFVAPITTFWARTLSFVIFLAALTYVLLIRTPMNPTLVEWYMLAYVITSVAIISFLIGFGFRVYPPTRKIVSRMILAVDSVLWSLKLRGILGVHSRFGPYITMAAKMVICPNVNDNYKITRAVGDGDRAGGSREWRLPFDIVYDVLGFFNREELERLEMVGRRTSALIRQHFRDIPRSNRTGLSFLILIQDNRHLCKLSWRVGTTPHSITGPLSKFILFLRRTDIGPITSLTITNRVFNHIWYNENVNVWLVELRSRWISAQKRTVFLLLRADNITADLSLLNLVIAALDDPSDQVTATSRDESTTFTINFRGNSANLLSRINSDEQLCLRLVRHPWCTAWIIQKVSDAILSEIVIFYRRAATFPIMKLTFAFVNDRERERIRTAFAPLNEEAADDCSMRSHESFNVNFAPTIPSIPHNNSSLHVENEAPHVLPAISGSRALSNHILWRSAYRRDNFVNPGTLMGPNHLQKKETVIGVEDPHSDLILTGQSESANAASTTAAGEVKHRRCHHRTHRSGVLSPGGAMALSATNVIGAVSTPTATLPMTPIGRPATKQDAKSSPSVGRMDAGGGEPPAGTIERPSSSGADGSAAKERRMEQQRRQQEFGAEKAFSTPIPLRHVPSFFVGADEEEDDKSTKAQSSIHDKTTPSSSSINRPYMKATATTVNGGMAPGDKDGGLGGHFGKKPSIFLPKGIPLPTSLAFTRKRQIKFRRKVYEFFVAPITTFWAWTLSFVIFLAALSYVLLIRTPMNPTLVEWCMLAYVITSVAIIGFLIGFGFRVYPPTRKSVGRVILAVDSVLWSLKLLDFLGVHSRFGPYITMAAKMVLCPNVNDNYKITRAVGDGDQAGGSREWRLPFDIVYDVLGFFNREELERLEMVGRRTSALIRQHFRDIPRSNRTGLSFLILIQDNRHLCKLSWRVGTTPHSITGPLSKFILFLRRTDIGPITSLTITNRVFNHIWYNENVNVWLVELRSRWISAQKRTVFLLLRADNITADLSLLNLVIAALDDPSDQVTATSRDESTTFTINFRGNSANLLSRINSDEQLCLRLVRHPWCTAWIIQKVSDAILSEIVIFYRRAATFPIMKLTFAFVNDRERERIRTAFAPLNEIYPNRAATEDVDNYVLEFP